jgi:hypothetical protein
MIEDTIVLFYKLCSINTTPTETGRKGPPL